MTLNLNSDNFRWEWLNSKQNLNSNLMEYEWTIYDDNIQTILNKSIIKNLNKCEFEINDIKFEAIFGVKMVQKNTKSGYERDIRLCIKDEDDLNYIEKEDVKDLEKKSMNFIQIKTDKNKCWYYWQWLNENNKWITYSPLITIELEKNYKKSKNKIHKLTIKETNTNYLFDFQKMEQINEKSKFSRKIQRVVSDVTNIKSEPIEGPSSNLRKRKNINYCVENDKINSKSITQKNLKKNQEDEENSENNTKSKIIIKNEHEEIDIKLEITDDIKKEESEQLDMKELEDDIPKTSKSGRSTKNKTKQNVEIEEDDEPVAKKLKSGRTKKDKLNNEIEENEEKIKTIKYTGDIPLDEKFTEVIGFEYKIYREGDVIFDCMLNQTNLQYNNNKFYLIQLIEKINTKEFIVWMRWGRVGKIGQFSVENVGNDLNRAKEIFTKKFYDKTYNEWEQKDIFEKIPGKYDLVLKEYNSKDNDEENLDKIKTENETKKEIPASKLDKKVQDLIDLICDISEMESVLKEMKYDSKKAPLGKLSKSQIKAGYEALNQIDELINSKGSNKQFLEASNNFYTRIPHDFGMRVPPVINTQSLLREKMKLLEILEDIEVAIKVLNQKSEIHNPIDRHYDQLNCKLKPIDHNDKMFKYIQDYLHKTHAPTHNNYKLKLIDVFEAEKPGEKERFNDCGNRMLLWHGSRLTNWAGILGQGLRIAPPEAPVTGYMFGKGCYFADCSSKSANYCYPTSTKNVGLLSLSEVSLGVCNELKQADNNADKLPKGKMSTKGLGRSEPDKSEWVTLEDNCVIPSGKLKSIVDKTNASTYSLLYNEYIVYNVNQVKLRYLVKVEFDFDDEN